MKPQKLKLIKKCVLLFSLLLTIPPSNGQLEAVLTSTKLPRPTYGAALAYDGADIIYLIGGNPVHNEILRYSISSGVLEVAGTNPGFGFYGIAETDRDGNPIFLSAGYIFKDVVRFNNLENTTELLATHAYDKQQSASVKINADMVLIIGGYGKRDGLLTFDTVTYESMVRADLPVPIYEPTSVKVGNSAFVFDYSGVLKIDLETFSSEVIARGFPRLSNQFSQSRAVYDGQNIYIIRGGATESGIPTGGMIRFNPNNYEFEFVLVENFPVSGSENFDFAPASVYVKKMNRIYMFGGLIYAGTPLPQDGIWYIDLNPANPSTTEIPPVTTTLFPDTFCVNRTNGMYPHPTECDMFLGCRDEVLTIYTCPPPLLFNPEVSTCDNPADVVCPFSCLDKPDGRYPHEDCSMFYLCSGGHVEPFQCPPPLLFHPVDRVCTFPEDVNCQQLK